MALQAQARLDLFGVLAALAGATSMATGIVITKRWGQPAAALTVTAWQLITGGIGLRFLMVFVEGLPTATLTPENIAGYLYLSVIGTALAYVLWFRGVERLPATVIAFLGLLSPVVAKLPGWLVAEEKLTLLQLLGMLIVLVALVFGMRNAAPIQRSLTSE